MITVKSLFGIASEFSHKSEPNKDNVNLEILRAHKSSFKLTHLISDDITYIQCYKDSVCLRILEDKVEIIEAGFDDDSVTPLKLSVHLKEGVNVEDINLDHFLFTVERVKELKGV